VDAVTVALDRAAIAERLPHEGAMCLLDGVLSYDDERIVCVSDRHRDPAHPLATSAGLSSVVAIELAAQAMALHGALVGGRDAAPLHGRLARVRDCVLECERMDTLAAPLVVEAVRIAGGGGALSYRFGVIAGRDAVARGSILVALAPAAP